MTGGYIGVFDSGIGGISLLTKLLKLLPNESFIYFGDNKNSPYGNKSKRELLSLAISGVEQLKGYGLKGLVLACNTLSTNVISELSSYLSIPIFGVFPPIEQCVINGDKTLVLCTLKTRECLRKVKGVDVVGMLNLARDIEDNAFDLSKVDFRSNLYEHSIGDFIDKKGAYDRVILGCTHYEFIKNEILDHFRPQKIISGNDFTAKLVAKYFASTKSLVNNKRNRILFIGENAQFNSDFFNFCGRGGSSIVKKL